MKRCATHSAGFGGSRASVLSDRLLRILAHDASQPAQPAPFVALIGKLVVAKGHELVPAYSYLPVPHFTTLLHSTVRRGRIDIGTGSEDVTRMLLLRDDLLQ